METFTWKPHGERILTDKYPNTRVEFQSGNEQVQANSIHPIRIWELKFSCLAEEMREIQAFFNRMRGGAGKFYWVDDTGETNVVRFANDETAFTLKRGFIGNPQADTVASEFTLRFRKVW